VPRPATYLAYTLDFALLVLLLLLFSPRLTGLPMHEWLGLALGLPLLLHLLLSWRWIATATTGVLRRSSLRSRINYLLNALLFILVVIEIVSGGMISAVAVPALGIATVNDRSWRALHNLGLNWTLLVIGLHVAMNWATLLRALRTWAGVPSGQ
jgi:hypothetical protein